MRDVSVCGVAFVRLYIDLDFGGEECREVGYVWYARGKSRV